MPLRRSDTIQFNKQRVMWGRVRRTGTSNKTNNSPLTESLNLHGVCNTSITKVCLHLYMLSYVTGVEIHQNLWVTVYALLKSPQHLFVCFVPYEFGTGWNRNTGVCRKETCRGGETKKDRDGKQREVVVARNYKLHRYTQITRLRPYWVELRMYICIYIRGMQVCIAV